MALWTPAEITTALWLDAADSSTLFDATSGGSLPGNNGAVARWEDKSGNGRHVTQSTSGNRPLRRSATQNGLDIVEFNGTSHLLTGGPSAIGQNVTQLSIFGVWRFITNPTSPAVVLSTNTGTGVGRCFIGSGISSQRLFLASRRLDADAAAVISDTETQGTSFFIGYGVVDYANADAWLYRNGTLRQSSTSHGSSGSTSNTNGLFGVGGSTAGLNLTHIAACELGFVGDISNTTRQLIEGYLAWKWGLQGNLPNDHPYKNAAPGAITPRRRTAQQSIRSTF